MPNGHGGIVRFFSVVVLLFFAAGLLAYIRNGAPGWVVFAGYPLAALIGERFAYHLHRWDVEEYGGAHAGDEEKAAARRTHLVGAVIYVPGAVAAWHFLTP